MTGALPSLASYFRKANAALVAARLLLQAKDGDGACNRAYYAMFDAAHAALLALDAEALTTPIKTHHGLIGKFGKDVILPQHLPATHGEDLNKVQRLRLLADYSGDPIDLADATWAVERAEIFVNAVRDRFNA